jgi:hypothetical protein
VPLSWKGLPVPERATLPGSAISSLRSSPMPGTVIVSVAYRNRYAVGDELGLAIASERSWSRASEPLEMRSRWKASVWKWPACTIRCRGV